MSELTFNEYRRQAGETAIYPKRGHLEGLMYAALGAVNEAGEVAGKVKKLWRDTGGQVTTEQAQGVAVEVGDVLWYLSEVLSNLNEMVGGEDTFSLGDVAQDNLDKLQSRKVRGVLGGSGDTR